MHCYSFDIKNPINYWIIKFAAVTHQWTYVIFKVECLLNIATKYHKQENEKNDSSKYEPKISLPYVKTKNLLTVFISIFFLPQPWYWLEVFEPLFSLVYFCLQKWLIGIFHKRRCQQKKNFLSLKLYCLWRLLIN